MNSKLTLTEQYTRGKHRFLKPAYANCINRLNTSQVEMQGEAEIKKQSKTWKN